MKKTCILLGTRPEIIKLSSIIRFFEKHNLDYFIIHTNQHYSENMDKIFFDRLRLPSPKYNLNVGSLSQGNQTGRMLAEIENVLLIEKPELLLVQGDTNSVLAGALAACKLGIKVGHIEAGLRSYDRSMPEEINRIVSDHVSDYLFCPTEKQRGILLGEGIIDDKIFVTGNTIVDAVLESKSLLQKKILESNNLKENKYILVTMHRPSNVDKEDILSQHLENISRLSNDYNLDVIFPIHPRTLKNIKEFNLKIPDKIKIIEPVDFLELLSLEFYSKIILTDSGGILEEACILGIPTLNLRENTERPECVEIGASKTVGSSYDLLKKGYDYFIHNNKQWVHPFGLNPTQKIIDFLMNQ
ncbi:MAG: UDP-N-acetylglucosamine 2-epimerase (non-hydrolyzing) [Candidatus Pacebacteria bacterium]|nr:UDP-N-acetylglucosamine 2-epimerase (non-hydrolyzing) [Candidatus Paceibacterota bacterium]